MGEVSAKAHRLAGDAPADDVVEPHKCTTAYEKDIGGVDLEEFLLRVLAPALGRDRRHGALDDLEERLLDALAGHVAGNRRIVTLARDLVDFVDVHDAALAPLDVVVGVLQQGEDDVFNVFADVAGLGKRGRIGDREGNLEKAREGLCEQSLAYSGWPDEQDVGLLKLDVAGDHLRVDSLVVVVDGNREYFFGALLADHILVEDALDFGRLGYCGGLAEGLFAVGLLGDDIVTEVDALVADIDRGAGNQLADFVLALPTKRANQVARTVVMLGHTASGGSVGGPPANDYLINQAIFNCVCRSHDEIAIGILLYSTQVLTGVSREDLIHLLARANDLARLYLNVHRLTLCPTVRLMDNHPRVRQRIAAAFGSGREQHRAHAGCLPQTQRGHAWLDKLHGVVDRHSGGHGATRRVDVEADLFFRILGLKEQKLRRDQVGDDVVDVGAEKNDAVLQKA